MSLTASLDDEKALGTAAPSAAVVPAHHDGPVDKALGLLEDTASFEEDPKTLEKLKRRIDIRLMPTMTLCYLLMFLDKSAISYANLFGFQAATHMHGDQFAWLGTIFYLGYLCWQPVAGCLLVRVPIKYHLGSIVLVWGVLVGAQAACPSFAALMVCRFLMGCAESGVLPILGAITGMWYTRAEQATRVSIWFSSVAMSQIIGGLIAFGMFSLNTTVIEKWQFIFILLGPITFALGIYILIAIPSSPAEANFLSPTEKLQALNRIRGNGTGTRAEGIKTYQIWEAFRDPRCWLAGCVIFTGSVPNGAVSSFGSVIVQGFGYSTKQTTLLGMTTGGAEFIAVCATIAMYRWSGVRVVPAMVCMAISVVGAAIMVGLPTSEINARFAGYALVFFWPMGQMLMIPMLQGMIGGHTKRATIYIVYQVFYSVGNICGTQIFKAKDAPRYTPAITAICICLVAQMVFWGAIWALNLRWNRQLDRRIAESGPIVEEKNIEFLDKTDWEIKSFRYPL